jgi:hypothetical protein
MRLIPLNYTVNTMLYPVNPPIANNNHQRIKGNQIPGVVRVKYLNFIAHSTMPNLIYVSIRECSGFSVKRRHYPSGRSGSGGGKSSQIDYLWLPQMNAHMVLTNYRQQGR